MRACVMLLSVLLFAVPLTGTTADLPDPPKVRAKSWLLIDFNSQRQLAAHDADRPYAPASLTKLMTAYLLFEEIQAGRLALNETVTISERATQAAGTRLFLRPGEQIQAEELIKGMIVRSANDATLALVERVAGSETAFVERMNARAREWDLRGTKFQNATGLDANGHVSSARELTVIARRLLSDYPRFYPWFALKEMTYNGIRQHNRNALLWRDEHADGIKTGRTRAAGWCLIASATRGEMRLIAAVLGAEDDLGRTAASEALLDFGFRNFETRMLYAADVPATRVRVWMGDESVLPLGIGQDLYLTLPRGSHAKLRARLTVGDMQFAPVAVGQQVGTLALEVGDTRVAEYPLLALRTIDRGNFFQRTFDQVRLWFE